MTGIPRALSDFRAPGGVDPIRRSEALRLPDQDRSARSGSRGEITLSNGDALLNPAFPLRNATRRILPGTVSDIRPLLINDRSMNPSSPLGKQGILTMRTFSEVAKRPNCPHSRHTFLASA